MVKGKILIACRDDKCRDCLLKSLSGRGMTICSVWQDSDVLLEVLERDYDVIIFDLDLSQLDGLKMVKILRKIRPKVSLVVLTSDPSKELGGKILQEGVYYYAVKPLNYEVINEAVFRALTLTGSNPIRKEV